jgi:protein-S-isoprenylcysteine O-methyltransferase Ste14
MNVPTMLGYLLLLFPLSEVALLVFKRTGNPSQAAGDRGSLRLLWFSIIASTGVAALLRSQPMSVFQMPRSTVEVIAVCLLGGGLFVRWIAILSLGRMFTVDVAIQEKHRLVQTGMYRHVRHPSYTGLLLEFLGLSVYFGSWICLSVVMVPITAALFYRIRCEERALAAEFGPRYEEYRARTKAIIPGII